MKKLLSILCFLFLFSGCSEAKRYPADDTFHFETDAQNCLFPSAGQRLITESENGYYFTLTPNFRYIFYADKETWRLSLCVGSLTAFTLKRQMRIEEGYAMPTLPAR